MTAARRVLLMLSVATLTLASPVYVRLAESPGLGALLRLAVLLQILPTAALVLADRWLEPRAPRAWRVWRGVLCAACLLAAARQIQVSLHAPVPSAAWVTVLVVVGLAVLLGAVAVRGRSATETFLVAFAPGLIAWTVVVGYTLLPPAVGTVRAAPPGRAPAVFVLLFDELDRDVVMPRGRVDPAWPSFTRLGARARAFTDATANYGDTCPSVGSLLTGRFLESAPVTTRDCLRHLPRFAEDNLFAAVARRLTVRLHVQYLTACVDGAFQCRGTAFVQARAPQLALLQHYVPDGVRLATHTNQILGPSEHTWTLPIFDQFLGGIHAVDARGTFFWVHLLLPHSPYVFDASGGVHPPAYGRFWAEPAAYARAVGAYRRQVGFVDALLGRFLDRLQAEGLADEAIVIVMSDHGFSSLDLAGPQLIDGLEATTARPRALFVVRAPGVEPGTTSVDYQHVDFKRLVLGLLDGAGVPEPLAPPRDKLFCDEVAWRVRDADGRWRRRAGPDGRPRACGSQAPVARPS